MSENITTPDDAVLATSPFGIGVDLAVEPSAAAGIRDRVAELEGIVAEPEDTRPTGTEIAESLTGWDEVAIETHIGKLSEISGPLGDRAIGFVGVRRRADTDGKRLHTDAEAKRIVFDMTLKELRALFRPASEDGADEGKA